VTLANRLIITIDGPAGSGKSTVAAALGQRLGIAYLDTGAMYRAVTLAALEKDVPLDSVSALARLAQRCVIKLAQQGGRDCVLLDGREVAEQIRSAAVTDQSHYVAKVPAVRSVLVEQQRRIAEQTGSLVTEGRDQGSVVFPDAAFKFYLDASAECRAQRRWLQVRDEDKSVSYESILAAQRQRDERDATRRNSPMKIPDDAVTIDTTDMTVDEVVETLYRYITGQQVE